MNSGFEFDAQELLRPPEVFQAKKY